MLKSVPSELNPFIEIQFDQKKFLLFRTLLDNCCDCCLKRVNSGERVPGFLKLDNVIYINQDGDSFEYILSYIRGYDMLEILRFVDNTKLYKLNEDLQLYKMTELMTIVNSICKQQYEQVKLKILSMLDGFDSIPGMEYYELFAKTVIKNETLLDMIIKNVIKNRYVDQLDILDVFIKTLKEQFVSGKSNLAFQGGGSFKDQDEFEKSSENNLGTTDIADMITTENDTDKKTIFIKPSQNMIDIVNNFRMLEEAGLIKKKKNTTEQESEIDENMVIDSESDIESESNMNGKIDLDKIRDIVNNLGSIKISSVRKV